MMDYCAKESTLNTCEDEIKNATIKMDIQETYKIMCEMSNVLQDVGQIINGQTHEEKTNKSASCLWEEARMLTSLAYENLCKMREIFGSII